MTPPPTGDAPLRILHVFRAPVGGLFRYVLDVSRGQIARGHKVGLVCCSETGGARAAAALAEIEPHLALGLHRIRIGRNPGPADLSALAAMRRLCRETRPDILHGHGSKGGLLTRLPAFLGGAWPATIYTPHGGTFHFRSNGPRDRLYRGMERLLARRTDLFLMESDYIAARMQADIGPVRAPVRIVHNGITEPEFEPVETAPDPYDVLYLGEMRVLKGVDTLLDALALLRRDGMALRALLVGAGPDEDAFRAQAQRLGLADDTEFAPPQPIREALAKARLFVMPSRGESLPYVILEAAAAAMPMVATRVGGIPEIFGPAADRLVPPSDPVALAAAIRAALGQTETARQADARELAAHVRAHFSSEAMVEGALDAYRAALAHRAGSTGPH